MQIYFFIIVQNVFLLVITVYYKNNISTIHIFFYRIIMFISRYTLFSIKVLDFRYITIYLCIPNLGIVGFKICFKLFNKLKLKS